MRIGFDAKRAFSNFTGLGNYARAMMKNLAEHFPGHSYFMYTPRVPDEQQIRFLDLPHHAQYHIRIPKSFIYELFPSLWRSVGIVRDLQQDGLDLYHGLSHELPRGIAGSGIKTVVTIHDLIFLRYPEFYKAADRRIYYAKFKYACKHADRIIAISEQTKRDIVHFFKTDEDRISIVNMSAAPIFLQEISEEEKEHIREKYNLPARFLLNVGTIEDRKNAGLIIRALKLCHADIPLVIIGRKTPYVEKLQTLIRDNELQDRVQFIHHIQFSDLPAIYRMASIFIYPSLFEGFGIPVIEALHSGTPVIATTGSCLEEAGGDAARYVSPYSEIDLAGTIDQILTDPELREKMIRKGYEYVERFTEDRIAQELMNVYQKTLTDE